MAGRPRKVEAENVDKAVDANVSDLKNTFADTAFINELKKENKDLKEQLEHVLNVLAEQTSDSNDILRDNDGSITDTANEYKFVDINPLQQIRVVSLSNGGVTLCTERGGKGRSFRFDKFGHFRPIAYSDLQDIISTNRELIETGVVYICDKDVVENNYLTECYKNFLDIKTIENILTFDVSKIRHMVSNTTVPIQETIISLVVDKILKNDYVDMNKVRAVGESCSVPCDIHNLALEKLSK